MDAFISYSSRNRGKVRKIAADLEALDLEVWFDQDDIRTGQLLGMELQESVRRVDAVVLMWSQFAARSRWVHVEWITGLHEGKHVLVCALDDHPMMHWASSAVHLKVDPWTKAKAKRLARDIRQAVGQATAIRPLMNVPEPELSKGTDAIAKAQQIFLNMLLERKMEDASNGHKLVTGLLKKATKIWPLDPMVIKLNGYHHKNSYMLDHWNALQAGQGPKSKLLTKSEQYFFQALHLNPFDEEALNGLGTTLTLSGDLDAAEYLQIKAISTAKKKGFDYKQARHDLAMVRRAKNSVQSP